MGYQYYTNCAGLTKSQVPALHDMTEQSVDVTYTTFRKAVGGDELDAWAADHGYDIGNQRGGLRLKSDWHVAYYRSKWKGRRCYYLVWSAYEEIFLSEEVSP